jgi:hypothetical protein
MAFGIGGFLGQGLNFNQNQGVRSATDVMNAMMRDMQQTAAMQMKMQTEMAQINMMMKLNEALAKTFKAIGDAVKGLAG